MTQSLNGRIGNRVVLFSCALGVALLAVVGQAGSLVHDTNHLRFSGTVALPGVVLPAGAYTFEAANPDSGHDVVRVWDRAHTRVYFSGFTYRIGRPSSMSREQAVSLGEAGRGDPKPILAWYPIGTNAGFQFIYR
jgi:hypothetical protein